MQKSKLRIRRTFYDLSPDGITDIEQASKLTRIRLPDGLDWDKLLQSQRILIVSEAGAGKTHECRTQQQVLWEQGHPAFYLELAQLATNNLSDLFSIEEEVRFHAWRASQSDVATFFLDSIDELKLTLGSFEVALKRLSKAISGQLSRVQIVVTTRPIAIDQQLIQRYFPIPAPLELIASGEAFADVAMNRQRNEIPQNRKETPPEWRNVALMPLSDEQIQEMAIVEGIDDAYAFLADIRARNAEDFARRPQDLVELCSDWREHRRIRTHREQLSHNVNVKLKPRIDRPEPAQLSPDKAREGARRLALAALLTRKLTIVLSAEVSRFGGPGSSLDPSQVLHDWEPNERKTLLERALFGFASYGRVRFHHRSVVEFLAAEYLDARLRHGMPIKAVKRLLFAESSQGARLIRPSMRPVVAWLAASQPSIFSEVCELEPEVLLDHADPESLPIPQRVDTLRCYVQRYSQGGWRGLRTPRIQAHRFASPDLADHVQSLWHRGIENYEVRELLLELIGAAPMPTCARIAYEIATDTTASHGERLYGIEALAQQDDPRIEALTRSMAENPDEWPAPLIRGAVVQLFPKHIAPERLCELLERIQESGSNTIDEFTWALPSHISERQFTPGYLCTLRKGLTDLIVDGLTWNAAWPHLSSSHPHLVPLLAAVCLRQIQDGEANLDILHSSVIALRLRSEKHDHKESIVDLRKALNNLPAPLREAAFWADDAFNEKLHPQSTPWHRLHQVSFDGPISLNGEQDGVWVKRILADNGRSLSDRSMMLHAALRGIWTGTDSLISRAEEARTLVTDQPELVEQIDQFFAPREINPELAKLEARIERQRQIHEKREAKRQADWIAFWREVAEHPDTAFSSEQEETTAWNLWQAMQRSGSESRASGWNRRFIEKYFSKEIADRLRKSMSTIWRNNRPTLRYERPANERNTFLVRWQLGLAAIAAEAEDTDWARKLSAADAELAARYAPLELNGFPIWLESLAKEHPAAVEATLGPELSAELDEIAAPQSFSIQLQNIGHSPSSLAQLFLPRLQAWLYAHTGNLENGDNERVAVERLKGVISILIEHSDEITRKHILTMAESQLKKASIGPYTKVWLPTLMCLNPEAGVSTLESLLSGLEPGSPAPAIDIFGAMFGERYSKNLIDLSNKNFTPEVLFRLTILAYQHVRPSDDITHEGVYSPDSRDHAESGRNALLSALLNTRGAEAWNIKIKMAADPLFTHFRDRLISLAREKAAEEADSVVLTESELAVLNRYGEAPPTTKDDMFLVLTDRLDDIEDLLLQDISPREAWALIKNEKIMRRELARALHNASNNIYTVDQEAVTADEKETDIRLRTSSQQGTIELKIGENWSGRDLRDTIKNQLVTRYMASENCRSGYLLVTVSSDRNWEHPDTADMLDIQGLRSMLESEAIRVSNDMAGCLRLAIKVLDLRPRLISS
ncbi:hypothetical protein [Metapseudomonas otitidis]|uniref:hypothetical protein n=1 Tax=Metapseudomonas otitidis TaxID=319939 RepID=UPI003CE7A1DC